MASSRDPSQRKFRVPNFAPFFGCADHITLFKKSRVIAYYSHNPMHEKGKSDSTHIIIHSFHQLKPLKVIKLKGHYKILTKIEEKSLLILQATSDKNTLVFIRTDRSFKASRTSLGQGFCRDLSQVLYSHETAMLVFWHAGEITYLLDPTKQNQQVDAIFSIRDGISRIFIDPIHNCLLGFSKSVVKVYSFAHKKVVNKMKIPFSPEEILCYKSEDRLIVTLEQSKTLLVFTAYLLNESGFDLITRTTITPIESAYFLTYGGFFAHYLVVKLQYRSLIQLKDTTTEYEFLMIDIWNSHNFRRAGARELQLPGNVITINYNPELRSLICKTQSKEIHLVSLYSAAKELLYLDEFS